MKAAVIIGALFLSMNICAAESSAQRGKSISVSFAIDGETSSCVPNLELQFHGQLIVPEPTDGGFAVPPPFATPTAQWSSGDTVDVDFTCGEHELGFQLHPSLVSAGYWKIGIEYPPHWIELFKRDVDRAQGTWISYLESECNDCDPGVVTWLSHSDPPPSVVARLQNEQPTVVGGRARDVAYGLAVFGINYEQNRDYLVRLLNLCLSRPKESSEDDVCDGTLLDYVTNLYWRGDSTLLEPLLQIADSRRDVIDDVGTFYANLLDGRTAAILQAMQDLPIQKQRLICHLAGEFELRLDGPKLDRVAEHLRSAGGDVADRCMEETERAAKHDSSTTAETR